MLPEGLQPAQEHRWTEGIQATMESTQAMPSCPEDSHSRDSALPFSFAFCKHGELIGLTEITQEENTVKVSLQDARIAQLSCLWRGPHDGRSTVGCPK